METLNPKLMPATSTDPSNMTMLPLRTRDAASRSRQPLKRIRQPARSGNEIVFEPELIGWKCQCCERTIPAAYVLLLWMSELLTGVSDYAASLSGVSGCW